MLAFDHVVFEGLGRGEEDALVGGRPGLPPLLNGNGSCHLLNGPLQTP